jgi:hypothetical protein
MKSRTSFQGHRIVPLALGLGVMILAAQGEGEGSRAQAAEGPISCKIEVQQSGGGVQLQGVVFASKAARGTYELEVIKSGGGGQSNISQDGEFDAAAGVPAKLGVVQLGGDGGSYHATLKVTSDGNEVSCEKTAGTRL